jgi:hypothetical protein
MAASVDVVFLFGGVLLAPLLLPSWVLRVKTFHCGLTMSAPWRRFLLEGVVRRFSSALQVASLVVLGINVLFDFFG